MARKIKVLPWSDTGFLGRTEQEDEEVELFADDTKL